MLLRTAHNLLALTLLLFTSCGTDTPDFVTKQGIEVFVIGAPLTPKAIDAINTTIDITNALIKERLGVDLAAYEKKKLTLVIVDDEEFSNKICNQTAWACYNGHEDWIVSWRYNDCEFASHLGHELIHAAHQVKYGNPDSKHQDPEFNYCPVDSIVCAAQQYTYNYCKDTSLIIIH